MKTVRLAMIGLGSICEEHARVALALPWKVLDRWFFVNGIHMLDLMCNVTGIPRKITAIHRAGANRRHAFDALLEFPGGVVGQPKSDRSPLRGPVSWKMGHCPSRCSKGFHGVLFVRRPKFDGRSSNQEPT